MKKQPVSPTRVTSCCLSPADVWRTLLTHLLAQHYGLALNDTPFGEEGTIQAHIDAGVSMMEALNTVVEKYDLVRTDRGHAGFHPDSSLITAIDVLRARKATGLLKRETYQVVSYITQGRRPGPQRGFDGRVTPHGRRRIERTERTDHGTHDAGHDRHLDPEALARRDELREGLPRFH